MTRHLTDATSNSIIGYDYLDKFYFITHRDTTTARTSAEGVWNILKIINSSTSITLDQVKSLADGLETIENVYYTLEDNGVGIKSIRFNDYKDYILILDGYKLYVKNTEIFYDLTMGFSDTQILNDILGYYTSSLGLDLTSDMLTAIYNYLINNTYKMHVYNKVNPEIQGTAYYFTNLLETSNNNSRALVLYEVTHNPENTYNYTTTLGNIESIKDNIITLTGTLPSGTTLLANDKIKVSNEDTIYIVSSTSVVNNKLQITTTENVTSNYTYPTLVKSVLTNTNYQTSTSGGTTTITITTESSATGSTPVYTTVGQINSISKTNKTITLTTSVSGVSVGDKVMIYDVPDFNSGVSYSVSAVSGSTITVTDSTQFASDYTFSNITAIKGEPDPSMLLNVTESADEEKLPETEFMLDNSTQLTAYLTQVNTDFKNNRVSIPTQTNYDSLSNAVPLTTPVTYGTPTQTLTMNFEGLYNVVYPEV